jgi:hypothetical protein
MPTFWNAKFIEVIFVIPSLPQRKHTRCPLQHRLVNVRESVAVHCENRATLIRTPCVQNLSTLKQVVHIVTSFKGLIELMLACRGLGEIITSKLKSDKYFPYSVKSNNVDISRTDSILETIETNSVRQKSRQESNLYTCTASPEHTCGIGLSARMWPTVNA